MQSGKKNWCLSINHVNLTNNPPPDLVHLLPPPLHYHFSGNCYIFTNLLLPLPVFSFRRKKKRTVNSTSFRHSVFSAEMKTPSRETTAALFLFCGAPSSPCRPRSLRYPLIVISSLFYYYRSRCFHSAVRKNEPLPPLRSVTTFFRRK